MQAVLGKSGMEGNSTENGEALKASRTSNSPGPPGTLQGNCITLGGGSEVERELTVCQISKYACRLKTTGDPALRHSR